MRLRTFILIAFICLSATFALGQTTGSTFTLANNPSQTNFGQTVNLTATLSPPGGALQVTFRDGGTTGTVIGTATMNANSGAATLPISTLSPGGHSLVASITPVGTAGPRFSNTVSQFVFTNFTLANSPNPSGLGDPVTLTATANPPTGPQVVTFLDGGQNGTPIGNATMNPNSGAATLTISTLSQGTHQIVASYSDPLNDGVAHFSNTVTQVVNRVTTSTTLTSSPNPSTLCQAVTLTASISRNSSPPGVNLTGNVTFFDGQTTLGTVAVLLSPTGGPATASLTVSPLAGSHSFTATYNGDQNFAPSSGSVTHTVNRALPNVTLTSTPNPSNTGQTVTMTATPAACTPAGASAPIAVTGSVTFLDGSTTLTTVNLSGGAATFQTSALASGTHPLSARYNGDTNYSANTSNTVNQVVGTPVSTTTLAVNPNPSTLGQQVTLSATVTPSNAPGGVQFFDGTTPLGQANVINGVATFQISTLAAGSHSLTGRYLGDTVNQPSTSAPVTLVVNRISTTTSLVPSANPVSAGQSLTLTATVSPFTAGGQSATGQVQFLDGGASIGTGQLSNGTATFTTSSLTPGSHTLTAVYAGDTNFNTSTSAPVNETVSNTITPTTTTLSVVPSSAAVGQAITMTATVTPSTATGTVAFRSDGVLIAPNVPLLNGTATFTTSSLPAGIHQITAVYNGSSTFSGSTSAPFNLVVGLTPTTTTLAVAPLQSTFGQAVNLVVTVTPATATGTVTFRDGNTLLGTDTLGNGGTASFSTSTLPAGTHSLVATYVGDTTFATSTSSPVIVQVSQASTTTVLTATPSSSSPGQGVLFTATVTPANATGTVTFRDGTTTLGTAAITAGSASTTISSLSNGNHSVTAVYSGDNNFTASTSSPITVSVGLTATTTTLSVSPATSTAGQTVTLTATVTPATATGTVTFLDGATSLGTATLANGTAALTISSLTPGSHSLTAVYAGNNTLATSTSSVVTATVNGITTTTALSSSPNPSSTGQTVTLTATVTPSGATGAVTFRDGTVSLGTANLSNGVATFTTAALGAGSHSLTASYGGDATRSGSASSVVTQVVNPVTALRITAPTALPTAILNVPYSQTFTATGGSGTLTWTLFAGTVPGLSMSTAGVLSGTPTAAGTTQLTVRVQDAAGGANATVLPLTVLPAPNATISVTQPTSTADQPIPQVTLGQAFPVTLSATFSLSFTPNAASLPANFVNSAVQFAGGGTTSPAVVIPANSTAPVSLPAVQLGTVAGTITVRLATLTSAGQSVLPVNPPVTTIIVPRLAPVIVANSVRITNVTSSGFTVFLDASSTPRDLTTANVTFNAASGTQLNGTQFTVSLTAAAAAWFPDTGANRGVANGGSFSLTIPFSFSGDTSAIGTVSVTVANSVGTSAAVTGGR